MPSGILNSICKGPNSVQGTSTQLPNTERCLKRTRTSLVWEYSYWPHVNWTVRCACNLSQSKRNFTIRCSTSTLKNHLNDRRFFLSDIKSHFERTNGSMADEGATPIQQLRTEILASLRKLIFDALTVVLDCWKQLFSTNGCFDASLNVPSHTIFAREVSVLCKYNDLKIKDKEDNPGMVSLTNDAWSSRIYKGYLSLTIQRVDTEWCLHHCWLSSWELPFHATGSRHLHCYPSCGSYGTLSERKDNT